MKTIEIKERINNFEGYTYKPGVYEVVGVAPVGLQVTDETAKKLLKLFPDTVKAGKG